MAHILVVEDDGAVRAFVRRALEMDGHTVSTAEDGEEGFDALQSHSQTFDLMLSDIKMPFMDGIELARLSSEHCPDLDVLLMTGYADQRERVEASRTVVDVVSKPFTLKQIRTAVSEALELGTARKLSEQTAESRRYASG
ncbi:MAG: response regulator [Pseudomonadota bacterium]